MREREGGSKRVSRSGGQCHCDHDHGRMQLIPSADTRGLVRGHAAAMNKTFQVHGPLIALFDAMQGVCWGGGKSPVSS